MIKIPSFPMMILMMTTKILEISVRALIKAHRSE